MIQQSVHVNLLCWPVKNFGSDSAEVNNERMYIRVLIYSSGCVSVCVQEYIHYGLYLGSSNDRFLSFFLLPVLFCSILFYSICSSLSGTLKAIIKLKR